MTTKTYGGYTVDQLRQYIAIKGDVLTSRMIRDLLDADESRHAADESAKTMDHFKEYHRGLMEAFHCVNMIGADPQGRTPEETVRYMVQSLAGLANASTTVASKEAESIRHALRELVECKRIKDEAEALHFAGPLSSLGEGWKAAYDRLKADYIHRQPLAWDAARAALTEQATSSHGISDADRLNFLIEWQAWVQWTMRDGSICQCQVYDQDPDEDYHILSGDDRFFNTPVEAIDAAILAQRDASKAEPKS